MASRHTSILVPVSNVSDCWNLLNDLNRFIPRTAVDIFVRNYISCSSAQDFLWSTYHRERSAPGGPSLTPEVEICHRSDDIYRQQACVSTTGWHATPAPFAAPGEFLPR